MGQQAVHPRYAHVVQALHTVAQEVQDADRLLCHRQVGCAGRHDAGQPGGLAGHLPGGDQARRGVVACLRQRGADGVGVGLGGAAGQGAPLPGDHAGHDRRHLLRRLVAGVDELRQPLPGGPVVIQPGEALHFLKGETVVVIHAGSAPHCCCRCESPANPA